MNGIITVANGSSSSLYGCVGCAIQDLILSKFPKDYFKYTAVSSELASRNIRRLFGSNTGVEMVKREKPYLIIQPIYSTMDQDGPLQGVPLTKNFDDLQYCTDKRYLFEVIRDRKYGYNLKFKMNRDRIDFDVSIVTNTLHKQLDIYRTMVNQIVWDKSTSASIALESVIPKSIVALLGKLGRNDIEEHEERIPILLKRLNACSGYPITYKMRNASATDEWFMYYTHNLIITYHDLNLEEGQRKNMSEDTNKITFRVTVEFNLPGMYFIETDLNNHVDISLDIRTKEYNSDNDTYTPMYTVSNIYSRFPQERNGMQLYGSSIFQSDTKLAQVEERIPIAELLDKEHLKIIRTHKAWEMNPRTIIDFILLKNSDDMKTDVDYQVDWNTLDIVIKNPSKTATYRIALYLNFNTLNEILNNTAYDRPYDVSEPKENLILTIPQPTPPPEEIPPEPPVEELPEEPPVVEDIPEVVEPIAPTTRFSSSATSPVIDDDMTNAEVHNEPLVEKKNRFSSSAK